MGGADFTAVSITLQPISQDRSAKNSFMAVFQQMKGLHPQPRILRWVQRRSTFRTREGYRYPLPSRDHSASVRRRWRADRTSGHWHSTPLRITRRFLRSKRKVFSHWLSLGRMANHFSATSGVVSSR